MGPFTTLYRQHGDAVRVGRQMLEQRRAYIARFAAFALEPVIPVDKTLASIAWRRLRLLARATAQSRLAPSLRCQAGRRSIHRMVAVQIFRSSGSLPPFSASFAKTCLCSQIFIVAVSSVSPS